jgi:hypothetical protein
VSLLVLTLAMNLIAPPETFAVFLLPEQKGLGVSRSQIRVSHSLYVLPCGVFGPFATGSSTGWGPSYQRAIGSEGGRDDHAAQAGRHARDGSSVTKGREAS